MADFPTNGDDRIDDTPGDDVIDALAGDDVIFAEGGDDVIFGEGGDDTFFGNLGDDVLFGGDGADRLDGGNGNDLLSAAQAFPPSADGDLDVLIGGANSDHYFVFEANDKVVEAPLGGRDTVQFSSFSYTLPENVENLQFERSARQGFGNSDSNVMTVTSAEDDSGKRMEGRAGVDTLNGAAGDDQLFGGADRDTLRGEGGNDLLDGGAGDDSMVGADGADTLRGGAGNDRLHGGALGDRLTGGTGADLFQYTGLTGGPFGSDGSVGATRDTITDFTKGQDRIDVRLIDANAVSSGVQDFTFIGSSGFTAPGQIRAFQRAEGTVVQGSVDFDATAELQVLLDDKMTLAGSDFIF
jgi:Ca2+-binding RTX toxin-like protein